MNAPQRTADQIKADNKKFTKLSQPRKRIAIARDALAQLGKRLNPMPGKWVRFENALNPFSEKDKQLQTVLNETEKCEVCAKGALFVCLVDKVNDLTVGQMVLGESNRQIMGESTDDYLKKLFTDNQLELIEIAFEGESFAWRTGIEPTNSLEERQAARAFFGVFGPFKVHGSLLRLTAILENIIANNGTFKPEILPVQRWVTPGFRG